MIDISLSPKAYNLLLNPQLGKFGSGGSFDQVLAQTKETASEAVSSVASDDSAFWLGKYEFGKVAEPILKDRTLKST
jgi:hypothetical protein